MRKKQRRAWFGLILLVSLSASTVLAQVAPQGNIAPEELRRVADRLFQQGRFDLARPIYLQIQPAYAKDAALNRDLGWCFYRGSRPDLRRAIQYWSVSWQIEDNEDLKKEAARAYVRLGRWEEGAKLLLDLAERHSQHPEHWRETAEIAESAQQYPQAIGWYRSYLEQRSGDISGRLHLAKLLAWEKQYTEAIAEYNIVLQSDPRNIAARIGVAQVLSWQGELAAALQRYEEILAEQPNNQEAQTGKAFALLWMGRQGEAKPLFQSLSRRRPSDPDIRAALQEITRAEQETTRRAAPPATPEQQIAALRPQIDEAFRQNDGARAVELLLQALRLTPGNVALQRQLAQAHLLAGRLDAAMDLLQQLASQNPDDPLLLRDLSNIQTRAGRLSEAADNLRSYLQKRPADRPARIEMAQLLSWTRRFDEASTAYQEVLREEPENLPALLGLAQVNLWQGKQAEALLQFEAILRKNPEQREALLGKGQALFGAGRAEEAVQLLEQLQHKLPQDREVAAVLDGFRESERQRMAQKETVAPDVEALIRSRQEALSQDPNDFEALRMLGELYARKNNYAEALTNYKKAHELRPQDRQLLLTLAQTLSWNKQFEESVERYRELVRQDPNPSYRLELARVLSWAGRYQESVEAYQQLLQLQPENREARLGMARVLSWNRNYDESLQNYRTVLEKEPRNRDVQVEYARVHSWKGDLKGAVELYSDLEKLYPKDRDVLLGKGQALQWAGRAREAQEILGPLQAQYPNDQEVLLAFAGTQLALGRQDLALRQVERAETINPENQDVRVLRSLILRQLRPALVFGFSPSIDSDDLHIYPYASTLYFSPTPRVRSYVRAAITPSMIPSDGISQGREALFGSTVRAASWLILRGEVGGNSLSSARSDPIGGGGFTLLPADWFRFDLKASREFLNFLPRPVNLGISRVRLQTSWDVRPTNRFLIHLDYNHDRYSDTNRSHSATLMTTRALVRGERLTLEGGYLYSVTAFDKRMGNGYFDPSQLQRHAGLVNLFGRLNSWFGYNFAATLGAEQQSRDPFRSDGTLRVSADFSFRNHFRLSFGYGYFRIASLARAGAYLTHSAFSTLEIQF